MSKFIHADLIAQCLEDAQETDEPWLRWQYESSGQWEDALAPLAFFPDRKYRRKPRTILINGFEVPEPVREPLKVGEKYWSAGITCNAPVAYQWVDDYVDSLWLAAGLIHMTEEAAKIHIDALLSFTRNEGN